MNRKDFIKGCGMACLAGFGLDTMQGCAPAKMLAGQISGDSLIVPLAGFEIQNGRNVYFKKYIVVQHDVLLYPICVYRFSETQYTALWMSCTHQGTELQVFGDKLQCPAHGSEFNSKGDIEGGPADMALRKFPVTIQREQLVISLKAV